MKSILFPEREQVVCTDVADPKVSPGEALVAVRASGVCHTDIEILHGRYGTSAFPLIPGHEFAGEVVAIGSGVEGFAVGDRVVIDPNLNCGTCKSCLKGLANLCETLGAYGVTTNGGFAEYCTVQTDNLVAIGDMDYGMAALAEPMGCVLNGIGAVGLNGVGSAVIFGAGPIGMLMAMALRAKGVVEVTLADIDDSRLELASSFGFSALHSQSDALGAHKQKIDLSVDATGIPAVAQALPSYTADGGKVLYFGVCPPASRIEISPFEIFRRQLTIAGAHSLNHNIPDALHVLRAIGPDISRLVSHKLPIEDIPAVLSGNGPEKTLKVQAAWE